MAERAPDGANHAHWEQLARFHGTGSDDYYDLDLLRAGGTLMGEEELAAVDRATDSNAVFTVAYVVRAVTPGKFVLPQAYVEDMYNPSRYGRTGTGSVEVIAVK